MIAEFNEKGHPMVFSDEAINAEHIKNKCHAAIESLTRQHGLSERLSEACFMLALSEVENGWRRRAEAAEEGNRNYSELLSYHIDRQAKAEAKLKLKSEKLSDCEGALRAAEAKLAEMEAK